jgi:hypothetical protein
VGLALAAEVLTAPNAIRIVAISLPAFVLLAYLVRDVAPSRTLSAVGTLIVLGIACRGVWSTQAASLRTTVVPGGRIAAPPAAAQKLEWLQRHARSEDDIFEVAYPGLYLPLRRLDPLYADNLMPIRLTPAEVLDRSVQQLEAQRVKFLVWNDALEAEPPPETRAAFDHFRQYVQTHYKLAIALENGEAILERR